MKKTRIISLLAALLAAMLLCTSAVHAEEAEGYSSLLVLGDSITTGYGLPDYTPDDPYRCGSYANRLAALLREKAGDGFQYKNLAVNGDKTSDLLGRLPSFEKQISEADLIVISIGGNDLLGRLPQIVSALTGMQVTDLPTAAAILATLDNSVLVSALTNQELKAMFTSIVTECAANMALICQKLRAGNPDARIIFLKQYNPAAGVSSMTGFDKLAGTLISQINTVLTAAVGKAGMELADAPSVIDCAAAARTNILTMDIHPNLAGHGAIFDLLSGMLFPESAETDECEHEFGEWRQITEGTVYEPYTAERVCKKCGETEQKEFPARETMPAETEPVAEPEVSTDARTEEKDSGCGSFAACGAAATLLAGAWVSRKKK